MSGFLALGVAAYFLWRANEAMEAGDNTLAAFKLLLGMATLFILGSIFL
jgi:hypothetical protein